MGERAVIKIVFDLVKLPADLGGLKNVTHEAFPEPFYQLQHLYFEIVFWVSVDTSGILHVALVIRYAEACVARQAIHKRINYAPVSPVSIDGVNLPTSSCCTMPADPEVGSRSEAALTGQVRYGMTTIIMLGILALLQFCLSGGIPYVICRALSHRNSKVSRTLTDC